MKKAKHILPVLLVLVLAVQSAPAALAADTAPIADAADRCAAYLLTVVKAPKVSSVGGEWTVIALSRSAAKVPQDYWNRYLAAVEEYTVACGGVLHQRKYTEYSRVVLALTAIGADPTNVGGFNLLAPLGDFDRTTWQGVNGAIWALIALDSGAYAVPTAPEGQTQATRRQYVDAILARQLPDGGWNMTGSGAADPDLTAMSLQALAGYQEQLQVRDAVERGVDCLSQLQSSSGGYASQGIANAESTAQVIQALCALDIPLDDSRFVKGGKTLLNDLLRYQQADGSFRHTLDGSGSSLMATEQALCALDAVLRAERGAPGLYQMADTQPFAGKAGAPWKRIAFSGCAFGKAAVLASVIR